MRVEKLNPLGYYYAFNRVAPVLNRVTAMCISITYGKLTQLAKTRTGLRTHAAYRASSP